MTYLVGGLLLVVAIETAAGAALWIRGARRAAAERALRESEARVRAMVEHTPAMIWTARQDMRLDYLNDTCMEFAGLSIEELRDDGWLNAVHPDDLDHCAATYVPAFEARRPFRVEYRMRRADGVYRWLLASGAPRYEEDGRFVGYFGCDIDITERREAEDRIRESQAALELSHREIQKLAGRLIEAQDVERARLARDLHDDVSQQLAGLSIALSGLRQRLDEAQVGQELKAELRSLHGRTTALAQNVRHLSHDLHPTVLRHAGLVAALTSYCAELESAHGIASTCTAEGEFAGIAPEIELCLYRIGQEALRNVIAHAGAHRADARLRRTPDAVEMTIADDGRGFDVAGALERGKGLGLVSITERVRLVGGTVSVLAEPGRGTQVSVRVPSRTSVDADAGSNVDAARRDLSLS